ncbi:STAS domain-containing protein, partial [Candidatus Sumerlaeota bacterium]|nr:STAS domain-containing protein [Candidatus Sumerlaeota bacterium]
MKMKITRGTEQKLTCSLPALQTQSDNKLILPRARMFGAAVISGILEHLGVGSMPNPYLLSIQAFVKGSVGYMYLSGRLVAESRFDFKKELRDMASQSPRRIIVSLGPLEYIDSAGMAALIGAWKSLKEIGGELILAEVSTSLKALFEVSSLQKFFKIFPTVREALEYFESLPEGDAVVSDG